MTRRASFTAHFASVAFAIAALVASPHAVRSASAQAGAAAEPAARYPFDPVCPWGRVADGQGMLVRCLDPAEAQRLAGSTRASTASGTALAVTPPPAAPPGTAPVAVSAPPPAPPIVVAAPPVVAPVTPPPAAGTVRAAPAPAAAPAVPSASAPVAPPAGGPAAPAPRAAPRTPAPPPKPRSLRVASTTVGAAQADTGELPEAQKELQKASERYTQCVDSNGGLDADSGVVTLRFLVRERGRAEGVSVKERRGVSIAAAKCVADVVDRRYVGYPAAPIVGATLAIEFRAMGAR